MSILGAGGIPALGLASSAAAGQQRSASQVDRDKADQAVQKLQADQVRLNSGDLDDSIETDFSHGQVPTGIPTDGCPGNDRREQIPKSNLRKTNHQLLGRVTRRMSGGVRSTWKFDLRAVLENSATD